MGYRSNVVIYIKKGTEEELKRIVKGAFIANDEFDPDDCEIGKNSQGEPVLYIEYTDYKWYDDYPIVKYWKNIFENIDDRDYLFTKTGEDWDDIEIEGEYGEAYPSSDIEFDIDFIR